MEVVVIVIGTFIGLLVVGFVLVLAFGLELRRGRRRSWLAAPSGEADIGNVGQPDSSNDHVPSSHH